MNLRKKIIGIGCAAAMLLAGCSDDFLKLKNENELSSDNFYTNIANFDLALNGVYDGMKNLDLFGQTYYIQTLLSLPHEADYWNPQCKNAVTSIDPNVEITWRGLYRIIARANDILDNAPAFASSGQAIPSDITRLNQIAGEAQFLRGFAYFHLVRLWGENSFAADSSALAVPLVLHLAKSRDALQIPRSSVGKVYRQIVADFTAAEAALPPAWDLNDIARANKFSAKAFLGQVHLYQEDYTGAKGYFEEILANSSYSLLPYNQYKDLFQGKHEFSSESIFEINYTADLNQNIWENGLGSGIALVIAPPNRGWSNCTPHGVNVTRFGSDPRLKIAMFAPTDSAADINGVMMPCTASVFNKTGHSFKKYNPVDYCVYQTNRNSGINYLIMRLADVYLMYAEVLNATGSDPAALEYVNKIRRRAFGFSPNSPQASADLTGLSGTTLRDAIREERFLELFAEGHRWFDIVRWKIVEDEILKYNTDNVTQGLIVYNSKAYYYPVPQSEADNNRAIIPSTGY